MEKTMRKKNIFGIHEVSSLNVPRWQCCQSLDWFPCCLSRSTCRDLFLVLHKSSNRFFPLLLLGMRLLHRFLFIIERKERNKITRKNWKKETMSVECVNWRFYACLNIQVWYPVIGQHRIGFTFSPQSKIRCCCCSAHSGRVETATQQR